MVLLARLSKRESTCCTDFVFWNRLSWRWSKCSMKWSFGLSMTNQSSPSQVRASSKANDCDAIKFILFTISIILQCIFWRRKETWWQFPLMPWALRLSVRQSGRRSNQSTFHLHQFYCRRRRAVEGTGKSELESEWISHCSCIENFYCSSVDASHKNGCTFFHWKKIFFSSFKVCACTAGEVDGVLLLDLSSTEEGTYFFFAKMHRFACATHNSSLNWICRGEQLPFNAGCAASARQRVAAAPQARSHRCRQRQRRR